MLRVLDIVMQWIIIDQVALNLVIEEMLAAKILDIVILDPQKFPNGKVYFEDKKRMFLEDRKQKDVACIVHNNFLHTKVGICIRDNHLAVIINSYLTNLSYVFFGFLIPSKGGKNSSI